MGRGHRGERGSCALRSIRLHRESWIAMTILGRVSGFADGMLMMSRRRLIEQAQIGLGRVGGSRECPPNG